MKKLSFLLAVLFLVPASSLFSQKDDSLQIRKIFTEALVHGESYSNLKGLCAIGHRLSGSTGAAKAVDYTYGVMKKMGLDTVWKQECMVPHWDRGAKETARILASGKTSKALDVRICALGGSVATPAAGITGEVIEVHSIKQLDTLGEAKIKGKIVFFNRAFDASQIFTFNAYGGAVDQRWAGPSAAAKYGAIATICRSMTTRIDEYPHTGSMHYDTAYAKVPCCAICTKDAEELSSRLKSGAVKFWFKMSCQTLPDEKSYNVIGEIRGSVHPEKVIVIGGHLDAWDLGDGAQDDGAGCVQSMEVLRLIKATGYKPRYTIRAVMFMNEENGGRGGTKYAEEAKRKNETHIAAIESDAGGFSPRGFGLDMGADQKKQVQSWKPLFIPYGIYDFESGHGGSDIGPLKDNGVPLIGLSPDPQRYFDFHHTAIDKIDAVNQRELELGGAGMAALVYLLDKNW